MSWGGRARLLLQVYSRRVLLSSSSSWSNSTRRGLILVGGGGIIGLGVGGVINNNNKWFNKDNRGPFILFAAEKHHGRFGDLKDSIKHIVEDIAEEEVEIVESEPEIKEPEEVEDARPPGVPIDEIPRTSHEAGEKDQSEFDWAQFGEILKPYWKLLGVAVGSAMIVAVINIEIPHLLGSMVDIVTKKLMEGGEAASLLRRDHEFESLVKVPAMKLVGLYLGQAACTFTYIYSLSIVGEGVATSLRSRLFASMLNQDIVFFDSHMTGEIMGRLTSDVQEFKSSFKQCISQGLRSLSQAIGCVISLYMISPDMTKSVVVIVPVIITAGSIFGRGLRVLSRKAQEQVSKAAGHAEETLANIRTVRAFAMEHEELQKYQHDIEVAKDINVQLGAGIGLFQGGANLFLNGVVLAVLYTGGKLIAAQTISSGDLMSFLVAAQTIQRSLANLSLLFGQFVRGIGAGGRVFQYINLPKTHELTEGKQAELGHRMDKIRGDVEFRNVFFRYPTRTEGDYILKSFNLQVPKGKVIAVVGPSGSGKSTLVNLLEGFYSIAKGEITLDGKEIEYLDPNWLRGEVLGLINQEPVLFASSIMENIRYGKPEASDEEVYQAAKNANAYNFIRDFPHGFKTMLGERGVTVSGGQKQRIAIARALIKDPKVLILDEATSALDTESEKIVQETLDSVSKGRTVIVIAHRLSTIQNADLIAVMSEGRVAELGTHIQLIKKKGLYYNLVRQQEYKAKTEKPS